MPWIFVATTDFMRRPFTGNAKPSGRRADSCRQCLRSGEAEGSPSDCFAVRTGVAFSEKPLALAARYRSAVAGRVDESTAMKMFVDPGDIYLHREPVGFRKSINGLVLIVE